MTRTRPARPALVSAVLAVVVLVSAAGGATLAGAPGAPAADATDSAIPGGPGADAMGTVGVHEERLTGATRRADLRRELAAADGTDERARVVARHLNESRARLAALERRRERLAAARDDGTLSRTAYRARVRAVRAGARSVERTAAVIAAAAGKLPDADLGAAGVREDDVDSLGDDARSLAERSEPADAPAGLGPSFYADVEALVANYNASVDGSNRVGRQLRGERVDLVVTADDERAAVSFRVDSAGRITDLRAGRRGDATVVMRTDRETVGDLADADDTAAALRRAVANDELRMSGVGPVNAVKWTVVDWLAGL